MRLLVVAVGEAMFLSLRRLFIDLPQQTISRVHMVQVLNMDIKFIFDFDFFKLCL